MLCRTVINLFRMARKRSTAQRIHQVNIRLTAEEIAELDAIAEREDRDRTYLLSWFLRYGKERYKHSGSLMRLEFPQLFKEQVEVPPAPLQTQLVRRKAKQTNGKSQTTKHRRIESNQETA